MAEIHMLKGGRGVQLHVREWGRKDGPPILLIHGWSQNHLCWMKQVESPLADEFRLVALDIRGHGMSDKPVEPEQYNDAKLWADDIAAVIDQLKLNRPVLVGWSYGGFIMCDYVRARGQDAIAGINFVSAAVIKSAAAFGTLIGPGFLENAEGATVPDLPTNIEAIRRFLRACFVKPISRDDFEVALCWNIVVPAYVRANLQGREINSDDVLSGMTVPVLMTHGRDDIVVLPAMGEHILKTCTTATPSWYDGVGHAVFMEDPDRFNRELADFTRRVNS